MSRSPFGKRRVKVEYEDDPVIVGRNYDAEGVPDVDRGEPTKSVLLDEEGKVITGERPTTTVITPETKFTVDPLHTLPLAAQIPGEVKVIYGERGVAVEGYVEPAPAPTPTKSGLVDQSDVPLYPLTHKRPTKRKK